MFRYMITIMIMMFRYMIRMMIIQMMFRYMEETGIHLPTVCKESLVQVNPSFSASISFQRACQGFGKWTSRRAQTCEIACCLGNN